jgi:uncharacterized protein (DUF58 family)
MHKPLSSEFLDAQLLSRLPSLEMRARYLVDGFLTGLHKSPFQGSSVEFKEYRDYQPGDDLKRIDWKVYARTDRLHVRLREDETDMSVYLLVDQSASMNFQGSEALMTKWAYTQSLAAAFLLFLQRQRDCVALGFAGNKLTDFVPRSSKPYQFHQMMANLHRKADHMESNLADSLRELVTQVRRRSIVIVFSDFYEDLSELETSLAHLRYLNCEVLFFQILDPGEVKLELKDAALLQDMESQQQLMLSPDLIRKEYELRVKQHCEDLSSLVRTHGGDCMLLQTSTLPIHALGAYLSQREGKR